MMTIAVMTARMVLSVYCQCQPRLLSLAVSFAGGSPELCMPIEQYYMICLQCYIRNRLDVCWFLLRTVAVGGTAAAGLCMCSEGGLTLIHQTARPVMATVACHRTACWHAQKTLFRYLQAIMPPAAHKESTNSLNCTAA